jgi:undecaprenyl pyrophosphate phosphatase UppP
MLPTKPPTRWELWLPLGILALAAALIGLFRYDAVEFLLKNPWLVAVVIVLSFVLFVRRIPR